MKGGDKVDNIFIQFTVEATRSGINDISGRWLEQYPSATLHSLLKYADRIEVTLKMPPMTKVELPVLPAPVVIANELM